MRCGVFLDRDNTLIANDGDLGDPRLVELLPGAAWAVRALKEAGYTTIVVSNQGGVARGHYTERDVDAVHERTEQLLRAAAEWTGASPLIDHWRFCPFHPDGSVTEYAHEHPWRKPSPGMILDAAMTLGIDLHLSWMIGDQERDIEAGRAAGCRTILVRPSNAAGTNPSAFSAADFEEVDLLHAAQRVLRADGKDGSPRWAATAAARLCARAGALESAEIRAGIACVAQEIAQRQGVRLVRTEVNELGALVEVIGTEIVALGFVAELRRATDAQQASHGAGPLWMGQ